MRLRLGWRRSIGSLAVALAATAATIVPSGPAHAVNLPVEDGTGWSFRFRYNSATDLNISGTVPGVLVSIGADDSNGDRTIAPLLIDTAPGDGFCAGLIVFTDNGTQVGNRLVTCGGSVSVTLPVIQGDVTIVPYQTLPGRIDIVGAYYVGTVPSFRDDPGMRTAGTGFNWNYTNATDFNFETVIPGAHVTGNGSRQGPDTRSARFSIFWTGGSSCVQADIQGESDPTIPGGNVAVACPFGSGFGSLSGMHNAIDVRTFAGSHVLRGQVAIPFRLSH
jgi:hypothetical protein